MNSIDAFRQFNRGRIASVDTDSKCPRQPARRGKIVGIEKHLLKLILDAATRCGIVPDLAEFHDQLGEGAAEPAPPGSQLRRHRQASGHKAVEDHLGDLMCPLTSCRERAQGLRIDRERGAAAIRRGVPQRGPRKGFGSGTAVRIILGHRAFVFFGKSRRMSKTDDGIGWQHCSVKVGAN
ncbi:hypothetical protein [Mesorhizobium sp. NZP2077]|uniref:hypothetical protein n=1 Tax=Mesorhizobium sp. NZP2077 TaxID=2483404 RepID=UPI001FEF87E9|nr:hypothetical protein [Mesorhizobium sp. NZP2077]